MAPGLLANAASVCLRAAPATRYAIIADSGVAKLYGRALLSSFGEAGAGADLYDFPAGEGSKSREQWASLSDRMLQDGVGRDAAVVALGGGVTGDLAGFVAATYMRGIPLVQVPTTLLAMLDSSVGGKTGVDTSWGKNLIGAFHHPSAVLIDPAALGTLPREQRCAGLAEAVKTAAILDAKLWRWIEARAEGLTRGDAALATEVIERVARHKAAVVSADPAERGRREILNFGHTVGHALEALGGYELLHGEAVAAGMRVEARLGELLGVTENGTAIEVSRALEACGLGAIWEAERHPNEVREALARDKKSRDARVRCVLLARIGKVATGPDGGSCFPLGEDELGEPLEEAMLSREPTRLRH